MSPYERCQIRPLAIFLIASLVSGAMAQSSAEAYTEPTHARIVTYAVEFVIAASRDTQPYVDGSTGASDYQLLRDFLSSGQGDSGLREKARVMGQASADTDRFQDLWLTFPGFFGSTYAAETAGVSFTTFSHFVNVHSPGLLWQFSGYSFDWVDANQKCSDAGFEDMIANFFIENSKATVDVAKSPVVTRYREPLLPNVTPEEYAKHFDQRIRFVHFWPVTNLARYWFSAFVRSPKGGDGTPFNLPWIGPALHAVADSTVPYHASGLSGCGHGPYEDMVETLDSNQQLYEPRLVKQYLTKAAHLKANNDVIEIVVGNARQAASSRYCSCALRSCDCPIARDEKAAEELVNLAVAATITVMRKALGEWVARSARMVRSELPEGRPIEAAEMIYYPSFTDVRIKKPRVVASDIKYAIQMESDLADHLNRVKNSVSAFERGQLSEGVFRGVFEAAVLNIVGTVARFPQAQWNPFSQDIGVAPYRGLPSLGEHPIRFRLPRVQEIRDEAAWKAYRTQRRRFFEARGLYQVGVSRGALEGRLKIGLGAAEKVDAEESLAGLKTVQESYIRSLAQGQRPGGR